MYASNPLFVSMPLSDFKEFIGEIIRKEIMSLKNEAPEKKPDELLSIQEVASLLKVSKVTIHKYKKAKLIQSYRIGRKIYFKRQELIDSMNALSVRKKDKS